MWLWTRGGISLIAAVNTPSNGLVVTLCAQGAPPVWGSPGTLGKPLGRSLAEVLPDSRDTGLESNPPGRGAGGLASTHSYILPASPGGRRALGAEVRRGAEEMGVLMHGTPPGAQPGGRHRQAAEDSTSHSAGRGTWWFTTSLFKGT